MPGDDGAAVPGSGKDDGVLEQKFVKEHLVKMQDAAAMAAATAIQAAAEMDFLCSDLERLQEAEFCNYALECTAHWLQDSEEQARNAETWCVCMFALHDLSS